MIEAVMNTTNAELESSQAMQPRRSRRSGFTLLEILIATAILTIGLVSIVALFPVAMNVGREVIETSNSVVIAQSVADAIRDGIRNRKRFVTGEGGITHIYFVFKHDGVTDSVPADPTLEKPSHDYFILLPRYRRGQKFSGRSEADRRFSAVMSRDAKTFIYPETDDPPNGNGDAFVALDDAAEIKQMMLNASFGAEEDEFQTEMWTRVKKTYSLGLDLIPEVKGRMRDVGKFAEDPAEIEDERESILESLPSSVALYDIKKEVLRQYSFAFAISPSYFEADISEVRDYEPGNLLYHVRVMVFRRFRPPAEGVRPSKPVYELDFEVAL